MIMLLLLPQPGPKKNVLARLRERFKEKPATPEEVRQLGLNAKRETFKTQIKRAKEARGSRFSGFGSGGSSRQSSYRRSSKYSNDSQSWLFSSGGAGNFLSEEKTPSLSFITGQDDSPRGRRKSESSGITGKGLSDLF